MPKTVHRLRVKTVAFRSSIEIAKFQHAHVEMVADVPHHVSTREALDELKERVQVELLRARDGDIVSPRIGGRFSTERE